MMAQLSSWTHTYLHFHFRHFQNALKLGTLASVLRCTYHRLFDASNAKSLVTGPSSAGTTRSALAVVVHTNSLSVQMTSSVLTAMEPIWPHPNPVLFMNVKIKFEQSNTPAMCRMLKLENWYLFQPIHQFNQVHILTLFLHVTNSNPIVNRRRQHQRINRLFILPNRFWITLKIR